MKPKPIVTTSYVAATFDGPAPRYLCRDTRHGHWVVTTDHQKAAPFATGRDAAAAAADYTRLGYGNVHCRPGSWRAYELTTRLTFTELTTEAA